MKVLNRNLREIWYCLYGSEEPIEDESGLETPEERVIYGEPQSIRVNVSPASGLAATEQFGNLEGYDKVIVSDQMDWAIDENTVLFIDKPVEVAEDGTPLYDYIVRRVAKSLNVVAVAVRKVQVS